jgi:serine/threonine-protein kinase RsbW
LNATRLGVYNGRTGEQKACPCALAISNPRQSVPAVCCGFGLSHVRLGIETEMQATFKQDYQSSASWVSKARKEVTDFVTLCGFCCEEVSEIVLAVGEAVNNAVEHARSPHDFSIWCDFDSYRLLVRVEDHGIGFSPQSVTANRTLLQPRGLGTFLINQLMDKAEFSFKPGEGTVLTLEKRKPGTNVKISKNMRAVLSMAL